MPPATGSAAQRPGRRATTSAQRKAANRFPRGSRSPLPAHGVETASLRLCDRPASQARIHSARCDFTGETRVFALATEPPQPRTMRECGQQAPDARRATVRSSSRHVAGSGLLVRATRRRQRTHRHAAAPGKRPPRSASGATIDVRLRSSRAQRHRRAAVDDRSCARRRKPLCGHCAKGGPGRYSFWRNSNRYIESSPSSRTQPAPRDGRAFHWPRG